MARSGKALFTSLNLLLFKNYFLPTVEDESEPALIMALNNYGTKVMAEDFLNCGNKILKDEAIRWAKRHGYTIRSSTSYGGPRWPTKK